MLSVCHCVHFFIHRCWQSRPFQLLPIEGVVHNYRRCHTHTLPVFKALLLLFGVKRKKSRFCFAHAQSLITVNKAMVLLQFQLKCPLPYCKVPGYRQDANEGTMSDNKLLPLQQDTAEMMCNWIHGISCSQLANNYLFLTIKQLFFPSFISMWWRSERSSASSNECNARCLGACTVVKVKTIEGWTLIDRRNWREREICLTCCSVQQKKKDLIPATGYISAGATFK